MKIMHIFGSGLPAKTFQFRAAPVRVIDGDTAILQVDLGFHVTTQQSIRLADINAPEMHGPDHEKAVVARNAVENWFATAQGDGPWPLLIQTIRTDDYGRFIAKIWRASTTDSQSLNDYLVAGGFAVPYDVGRGGI